MAVILVSQLCFYHSGTCDPNDAMATPNINSTSGNISGSGTIESGGTIGGGGVKASINT